MRTVRVVGLVAAWSSEVIDWGSRGYQESLKNGLVGLLSLPPPLMDPGGT